MSYNSIRVIFNVVGNGSFKLFLPTFAVEPSSFSSRFIIGKQ